MKPHNQTHSGPVMDSNKSGPEESKLELEEEIGGDVGRDMLGKPLPRHLGPEMGCLNDSSAPCDWGPGVLTQVHRESKL